LQLEGILFSSHPYSSANSRPGRIIPVFFRGFEKRWKNEVREPRTGGGSPRFSGRSQIDYHQVMQSEFPNPLLPLHQEAEAEFQNWADVSIVLTFGEPQAEYSAIRKGAGVIDLPQRGILELSGKDRLAFLNNLLTNQTWDKSKKSGLQAGQGVYAFMLNLRGRIVADMNVFEVGGERTLLEMDVRLVEPMREVLEKYVFAEQVKIQNRIGTLHEIAIHGPGAVEVLKACGQGFVFPAEPSPQPSPGVPGEGAKGGSPDAPGKGDRLQSSSVKLFDEIDAIVWRDDPAGVPGFHLILPTSSVEKVWTQLLAKFGELVQNKRMLRPIGWAAFNATRIEAGRPIMGIDFDSAAVASASPGKKNENAADSGIGALPAQTGLFDRAVSVTKGCYLGQEIVARMHARSQVAKQVAGIRMADDALPIAGNVIGAVTSSTVSPILSNASICLAMIKRPHFAIGTKLKIPAEGAMRDGTVVALPFVGG
jgi:folate-binding protein YgfZ